MTSPASAQSLQEALAAAYQRNPDITAERARQRSTDEAVAIARADAMPEVITTGSYTDNIVRADNDFLNPGRFATAGVQATLPLYRGGQVQNSIRAADARVSAGRSQLLEAEANVFTDVVAAYVDVIRDEAIVSLNRRNLDVLEVNLTATRDRFDVGELTRTDVNQSEARLALARSQLRAAQARLISSRENFIAVTGLEPSSLQAPPTLPRLPATSLEAQSVAIEDNPLLEAARANRTAARYDVAVARAGNRPRVSAVSGATYINYLNSLPGLFGVQNAVTAATAGIQVTIPIFQGGRPGAQVRRAQADEGQAIEAATGVERVVIARTRSAFAVWRSTEDVIEAAQLAVEANTLSLAGVRAENSVGDRTIIEVLNAEQELLSSQVALISARRDAYVAAFALLAVMGRATADTLGLDPSIRYDPAENYRRVRNRINDFDGVGQPQPIAPSTQDIPIQSDVAPALDIPEPRLEAAQAER